MESVKCNSDGEAQPTSMSICQMPRSRGNRAEILAVIFGCTFLVICKDTFFFVFFDINP
jgi:hypothetical protein